MHNYQSKGFYHITLVVEGRRPFFGHLVGKADAPSGSPLTPHIELSPLGERIRDCWYAIPHYHPEIKLSTFQVMPDHFHGLLYVEKDMQVHLSEVIKGLKVGCRHAFCELMPEEAEKARQAQALDKKRGFLFEKNYNDTILLHEGQLKTIKDYIRDNPRRLALRRENLLFFHVYPSLTVVGVECSAIGNTSLLLRPIRQVQVTRRIEEDALEQKKEAMLEEGRKGAVLASPAISQGEKAIMRAAFDQGMPVIHIMSNGLDSMYKPPKAYLEAFAAGRMLFISPFSHSYGKQMLYRNKCKLMNALAYCLEHGCEFERKELLE